jgi:hypothetical protein
MSILDDGVYLPLNEKMSFAVAAISDAPGDQSWHVGVSSRIAPSLGLVAALLTVLLISMLVEPAFSGASVQRSPPPLGEGSVTGSAVPGPRPGL